jgi:hypothetical protein
MRAQAGRIVNEPLPEGAFFRRQEKQNPKIARAYWLIEERNGDERKDALVAQRTAGLAGRGGL